MRQRSAATGLVSIAVSGGLAALLTGLIAVTSPAGAACRSLEPLAAESLFTIWQQAVASGDARRLEGLYAADAVVIGPSTVAPATTTPAHRREIAAVAGLGPMTAVKRTVATGCESVRDYGTMARRGDPRTPVLRYSRVYEMREGRWLITLEHISGNIGGSRASAELEPHAVPRPVPAVAGYLKVLPPSQPNDPIGGLLARYSQPVQIESASLPPLAPEREIAMTPGSQSVVSTPVRSKPVAQAPARPVVRKTAKNRRWIQDLPGFRTVQ